METNETYDRHYARIEDWSHQRKEGTWWEYWEEQMSEAERLMSEVRAGKIAMDGGQTELVGFITSRIEDEIEFEIKEWRKGRRHGNHDKHIRWMIDVAHIPEAYKRHLVDQLR